MIRHAVLQLKPQKGHLEANLEHIAQTLHDLRRSEGMRTAHSGSAANLEGVAVGHTGSARNLEGRLPEVVVLPEAFLSAYFLQGGVREVALTQEELVERTAVLFEGLEWPGMLDMVVGFYERDGGTYYNAAAYLELGGRGLLNVHRKVFLPTYGVFDEERYISRGSRVEAFDTRFGRVATLICEDFWHSATGMIAALDGAEIIYVPSASPARGFAGAEPSNVARWKSLTQAMAAEHGLYVVLSSLVGLEAGKGLAGGSVIAGPEGNILGQAPVFEEAVLLGDIDLARIPPIRYDNPLLADLESGLPLLMPDLGRVMAQGSVEGRRSKVEGHPTPRLREKNLSR